MLKLSPTLSLCMIVKNEEQFLEQCLLSVQGLVDEIIIVDTGSSDKTKEIAAKFTDKIFDFKWCDDFSAARNESLKHASCDWILVLDADEIVSEKDHVIIKEALSGTNSDALVMVQRNYCNDSRLGNWVSNKGDIYPQSRCATGWDPNPVIRLFKNNLDILFVGRVHEYVDKNVKKYTSLPVPIHHVGYADSINRSRKFSFYKVLCEKNVEDDKTNIKAKFELATFYYEANDVGRSIEILDQLLDIDPQYDKALVLLGAGYLRLKEYKKAKGIFLNAMSKNIKSGQLFSNMALVYIYEKKFEQAIDCFIKAIEFNPQNASFHFSLGQVFQMVGDHEKAYMAINNAIDLNSKYKEMVEFTE